MSLVVRYLFNAYIAFYYSKSKKLLNSYVSTKFCYRYIYKFFKKIAWSRYLKISLIHITTNAFNNFQSII